MSRKAKPKVNFSILIDPALRTAIDEIADKNEVSVGSVTRDLIELGLKSMKRSGDF